jgi:hypothetical protein
LEDENIRKVGHDLKFDAIVLAQHGISCAGSLRTSCSRVTCSTPIGRRIRSKTAIEHVGYKALREEDVWTRREGADLAGVPLTPHATTRASAPIWRCSWPHLSAS